MVDLGGAGEGSEFISGGFEEGVRFWRGGVVVEREEEKERECKEKKRKESEGIFVFLFFSNYIDYIQT